MFHDNHLQKPIPYWKLILLRYAYDNDDHTVQFPKYNGPSYQKKNNDKPYHDIKCLNPIDNYHHEEIKEITTIFRQWIQDVMMQWMNSPTALDDVWISIRYGSLYLTRISPYVENMKVKQFKQQVNGILRCYRHTYTGDAKRHQFTTGFFPIYNNFPTQIQSLDGNQFTLDNEIERFRIAIDDNSKKTFDYDAQMKLISSGHDEKYLKLDIKDNLSANDVRFCIIGSKENDIKNAPSQPQNMIGDPRKPPPILRDSRYDSIRIRSEYRQSIRTLRHKKIKSYKLSANVQLSDTVRQATIVKLSHIVEYFNLDQLTGQFKDKKPKTEIHVEVHSLKQLLNETNCELLAENLHRLTFTILPQYLSGSD